MVRKQQFRMNRIISYPKATKTLSLKEKIGQLFMPAAFINDNEEEIQHLIDLIKTCHIGGLCFFHSRASAATNFEGKKKIVYNTNSHKTLKKLIQRYQSVSKYPLLISIDAEWGLAMRIENTPQYPYAITLGAIENDLPLIFQVGKQIANDCKQTGIHWNFSPVVDINNNPNNPVIGYRSFGENKKEIVEKANAFIRGSESEGILTCIKHFPGHGDTSIDSHLELPLINKSRDELLSHELYPFRELIKKGVDSVMVGHLSVPALSKNEKIPATVSKVIIKGILRKEMNFKGVIVSDALNMHSVSKMFPTKGYLEWLAFDAGNDILCFAENVKEGLYTILKNALSQEIENSFERVWKLKEKAIRSTNNELNDLIDPKELNLKLAQKSLNIIKSDQEVVKAWSKNDFMGISFGKDKKNTFFTSISKTIKFQSYSNLNDELKQFRSIIKDDDKILLAIFPPKVKPTENFGFSEEDIQFIQDLILDQKVILYLFGNPYLLNKLQIQNAISAVIIYQDFEVFQKNAATHFTDSLKP